jgi:DNA modification methylase
MLMLNINTLYEGDCLDIMKQIDENSIDLIVTSPPYYLNKEYEKTISYDDYIEMMQNVFLETNRILKGGGYAVFNFGDYFNSGNRFYDSDVPACYPASINYFKWGVEMAKMDLQATRIWRKQFAKMGIPFVCNKHPRPVFDYEHVWTFRKKNGSNVEFVNDRKMTQRGVIGETWTSKAGLAKHCAAFPVELPEWAIQVYSQENDTVLDMFAGSCTTAIAAKKLNRNWICIEKLNEYFNLGHKRIEEFDNLI